jgi:hypothetical protein
VSCCIETDPGVLSSLGFGRPAAQYATAGFSVLPLIRKGKRPHRMLPLEGSGGDGVHHATAELSQAERWWKTDPAANVGIATGVKSHLAVIDLDVKGGHNGTVAFTDFLNQYRLGVPAGAVAVTPSGGYHIYLRTPAGAVVPERPAILPGVDVKGDGGYVVAAPSLAAVQTIWRPGESPGGEEVLVPYRWADRDICDIPDAPWWLLPWLHSAVSTGEVRETADVPAPDVDALKQTGIAEGSRNATIYRLACSRYRSIGTGPAPAAQVRDEIQAVYEAGSTAGLSWREVLTTIESARRWAERQDAADEANADAYAREHPDARRPPRP